MAHRYFEIGHGLHCSSMLESAFTREVWAITGYATVLASRARQVCKEFLREICHPPPPHRRPTPRRTHAPRRRLLPRHHHHHPRRQWRCRNDYNAKLNHGNELTRTPCRLERLLAGDMADHGSIPQPPREKLMGCHHHQGFCDVCASLQNHGGQPPHLAHTKAPIVPALDPGSSSLRISFLHSPQQKVLGWAPAWLQSNPH